MLSIYVKFDYVTTGFVVTIYRGQYLLGAAFDLIPVCSTTVLSCTIFRLRVSDCVYETQNSEFSLLDITQV